ncbi:MAG: sigma-70 family RNA polymerase sigma factor [Planctomycetota bacterium]
MSLTDLDRRLIRRCLNHEPEAWREFVDRFIGVIYHAISHSAHMRSVVLDADEVEDIAADVMTQLVQSNFKILRHFRGKSSLATYLTVISRRIVVNRLARRQAIERIKASRISSYEIQALPPELRIETEDEVQRLLGGLEGRDAELIRSFYLENKSYREISEDMGIPENSVGPLLSRLRDRLRKSATKSV